jgi:hypothetical protein
MTHDRLLDLILGYDDSPSRAPSEGEMELYYFLWGLQPWKPARFIDLVQTNVFLRDPRNEIERRVTEEAAAVILRAAKSSMQKGGRPRAA